MDINAFIVVLVEVLNDILIQNITFVFQKIST